MNYPVSGRQPDISRIAVFDMDETLGSFARLSKFIYTLTRVLKRVYPNPDKIIQDNFNAIMDLYPEVLRPKIMEVMRFLVEMKRLHKCKHVMIYTNNTGPREWIDGIKNYFNYKSGFPLFDRVIGAFKRPNGEVVEVKRTSHNKTYNDFVRCSNLEGEFEVFFVDDRAHPGMHTKNVYVIEVKPYERQIPQSVFIKRFMSSQLFKALGIPKAAAAKLEAVAEADDAAEKHMVPYTDDEREVDIVVGETILEKIRWFFNPHPHLEQVSLHPNYSKKSLRRGGPKSAKRTKRRTH
jgi:hypothetical protein